MNDIDDAKTVYADIINREHHVSKKRRPMSRMNRASQFSPFDALSGYGDMIRESERETEEQKEVCEEAKAVLNDKLVRLFHQGITPDAVFTVFVPDMQKSGGRYEQIVGKVAYFDELSRSITLEDGTIIYIDDISEIECDQLDD